LTWQIRERQAVDSQPLALEGVLVIVGVVVALVWSLWPGVIIGVIGLVAFGGFGKGTWYSNDSATTEMTPG